MPPVRGANCSIFQLCILVGGLLCPAQLICNSVLLCLQDSNQRLQWLPLFNASDLLCLERVTALLKDCSDISSRVSACILKKVSTSNERLAAFLAYWKGRVANMREGEILVFPGGFSAPKNAGSGHAVITYLCCLLRVG